VLSRRRAHRYDPDSLALAAKLLEVNPEVYTAWNFRREALAPALQGGGDGGVAAAAGELALTQRALLRNPKSYAAWHHRRWVVGWGFCSLEAELALVQTLLDADERNFHGWAYRAFVAGRMGMPAARELGFTQCKIEQNFSNYSAWHCRTARLPALHAPAPADGGAAADAAAPGGASASASADVPAAVLEEEYELVKQAFYTEPEDQSGWFYHRWLLGCSLARYQRARGTAGEAEERATAARVLASQAEMCRDLLEMEPGAKWPLLTLTRLQELQAQVGGGGGGGGAAAAAEVQAAYEELAAVDPMRAGFYKDAAAGKAHVVAAPAAPPAT
jgi:geranylgeranyl transferase type-2 subunit alpha